VTGTEFANATKAKVQIDPGKTTDVGTIVVQRGRAISGKVVDSAGQPVAGARVAVGYGVQGTGGFDDRLVGGRSTVSDQSGSFTLVGLDEKLNFGPVPLVIAAIHPVRGRSLPVGIPEGVEHPPDVTLQLRASGSISGRVTQAGKPIAYATVGVGWPELGVATTTDDGDFIISRLPEGPVVLRTILPTGILQPFSTTVTVVGGKQVEANIDVPVGTLTLVVNVKPLAGDDVRTVKLFLFSGTVAIDTYKQVAPQLWQSSQGFGQWRGAGSPPPKFGKLIPGDYTVCALPLSGDSNAPGFMERLREHGDAVRVYCTPAKVALAPDEQSIVIEVPSMQPLPPK
jgi:hypothetical protein